MTSELASKHKINLECKDNEVNCNAPGRPQRLRLKTEHYYDVKLPTYEESQKKYAKFLESLHDEKEKQE